MALSNKTIVQHFRVGMKEGMRPVVEPRGEEPLNRGIDEGDDNTALRETHSSTLGLLQDSIMSCTTYWFNGWNAAQLTEEEALKELQNHIEEYKTRKSDLEQTASDEKSDEASVVLQDFEYSIEQLTRILKRCKFDPLVSFNEWKEWISWRREHNLPTAKDTDFEDLIAYGLASWSGHDREGRPCLILTGRNLDPKAPKSRALFKRYVAYIADKGMLLCNEEKVEQCVILYDRRDMGFENIDTGLVSAVQPELKAISRYYKDRIAVIYILHLNILWRVLFTALIVPALWFVNSMDRLLIVQSVDELGDYFEGEELHLNSSSLSVAQTSVEMEVNKVGASDGAVIGHIEI